MFSSFGRILKVFAAKTYKLRGQAWVVYDSKEAAQLALQGLQNFDFYDKPLVRYFAYSYIFRLCRLCSELHLRTAHQMSFVNAKENTSEGNQQFELREK